MKKLSIAITGILLAGVSSAYAADKPFSVSGNVAMTSDYVWRGISQTMEDPAIQGGFNLKHESGAYLGTWGSNVRYEEEGDIYSGAHMETDLIAGYAADLGNGLGLDVNYTRFLYPSAAGANFGEFSAALTYSIATFKYAYSNDVPDYDGDGSDDPSHYLELGLKYELPQGFTLGGTVGRYYFSDTLDGEDDAYVNWSLSVSTSVAGLDLTLAYTDTDIENDKTADGRAVFTVSKSF